MQKFLDVHMRSFKPFNYNVDYISLKSKPWFTSVYYIFTKIEIWEHIKHMSACHGLAVLNFNWGSKSSINETKRYGDWE